MKFKKLLGVFLPLLLITMAAAAVSELTNVSVASHGDTTTVTLQTSGAFSHNEYRPADNLLLVDLAGVSAGKLIDQQKALSLPGVKSYRVQAYKGASGAEVTRIELNLEPSAQLHVADAKGSLNIVVKGNAAQPSAAPVGKPVADKVAEKAAPVKATAPAAPKVAPAANRPAEAAREANAIAPISVSKVALVRGQHGIEVEITGPSEASR